MRIVNNGDKERTVRKGNKETGNKKWQRRREGKMEGE